MKVKMMAMVVIGLLICGVAFALDSADKVYSVVTNNSSGNPITTVIPITTIRPDVDKLMGYVCIPYASGNYELFVGIFDGTDKQVTGEVFAENEKTYDAPLEFWADGKYVFEGVVVRQGANTSVQVYFKSK